MQSESLVSKWLRFFLLKDKLGKIFLALTGGAVAVWLLFAKDSLTFGLVAGGFLAFTILFSFLNYITVGKYKEAAEIKFYDAIYSDCGLSSSYKGRDMKQIRVQWKGLRVSKVLVTASANSSVAKSAKEWLNIKLSVEDSFKLAGNNVAAVLDDLSSGRLTFVIGNDEQFAPGGEYSSAWFGEGLRSFTYEMLAHYGTPLPRLQGLTLKEDGETQPQFQRVQVELMNTPSSYEKKSFESNFRQRYEASDQVCTFVWNSSGVTVESIKRGSQQDKSLQASKSIADLISSSISTAFHWYDSRAYLFSPNMIDWSADQQQAVSITIDFLQSDVSRPDQVARFEELVTQGLTQLFRGVLYEYIWNVNAFEKTVTIKAV
jgi:hypothetical protein